MKNTALKNTISDDLETTEYVDEYDDTELSEELISDLNLALEQVERGEVYTEEEVKAELKRLYGIEF